MFVGGSRLGSQAAQFAMTVIVSRILAPREFGLLAIASTFFVFANIFTDLGLNGAVVQRARLDETYLATAFWLNALTGLGLAGLMSAAAWPASWLYHAPELRSLIPLAALQLPLSFGVVQLSLLERKMDFRRVALTEIAFNVLGYALACGLAELGLGPASVIIGTLVTTLCLSLAWSLQSGYVPTGRPSRASLRELWAFGGNVAKFNVVNYWARNLDTLLLGRLAGPAQLGLYTRAYSLMLVPVQLVTIVVSRVLLPRLGTDRGRAEVMRASYLRALRFTSYSLFMVTGLLFVAGKPLISLLYGTRWAGAGLIMTILMISTPLQIISGTCGTLYQVHARTAALFRRGAFNAALLVSGILVGAYWQTPVSVAIGFTVANFAMFFFAVAQPWSYLDLSFVQGLVELRRSLAALVVAGGAGILLSNLLTAYGFAVQIIAAWVLFFAIFVSLNPPAAAIRLAVRG